MNILSDELKAFLGFPVGDIKAKLDSVLYYDEKLNRLHIAHLKENRKLLTELHANAMMAIKDLRKSRGKVSHWKDIRKDTMTRRLMVENDIDRLRKKQDRYIGA